VVVGAVGLEFPWNDMYLKEIQLYMSRATTTHFDPTYENRAATIRSLRCWTENRNMEEFLRLNRGRTNGCRAAGHA